MPVIINNDDHDDDDGCDSQSNMDPVALHNMTKSVVYFG